MIFPLLQLLFPSMFKSENERKKEDKAKLPFGGSQIGGQYKDRNGNVRINTGGYDYDKRH